MAQVSAFTFINVAATLDGLAVRGFYDGNDVVSVEQVDDVGSLLVGADGSALFSQFASRAAQITLRLQHTSPTHRQLINKWKQQRAGRMLAFPFTVTDTDSGEGGAADQCFVLQAPTDQKGKETEAREWVLVTGDWEPHTPNG